MDRSPVTGVRHTVTNRHAERMHVSMRAAWLVGAEARGKERAKLGFCP